MAKQKRPWMAQLSDTSMRWTRFVPGPRVLAENAARKETQRLRYIAVSRIISVEGEEQ